MRGEPPCRSGSVHGPCVAQGGDHAALVAQEMAVGVGPRGRAGRPALPGAPRPGTANALPGGPLLATTRPLPRPRGLPGRLPGAVPGPGDAPVGRPDDD